MDIKTNETIYKEARAAGLKAVAEIVIEPMVVVDSRTKQKWTIEDGPCGFAWVVIKPSNCSFAKYMIENKGGHKRDDEPGVMYWISNFNQSMEKKSAYAYAFAQSLRDNGIKAYAAERMD